jgi:hypothetical protein
MATVTDRVALQICKDAELVMSNEDGSVFIRLHNIIRTLAALPRATTTQMLLRAKPIKKTDVLALPTMLTKLSPDEPLRQLLGVEKDKAVVLYLYAAFKGPDAKKEHYNFWGLCNPDGTRWLRFKICYHYTDFQDKDFHQNWADIWLTDDVIVED